MTGFDTAFVQQILDIAKRQREPDIEHHGQADDLGTGFETLEGEAFGHNQTLIRPLPCLKLSSSEETRYSSSEQIYIYSTSVF